MIMATTKMCFGFLQIKQRNECAVYLFRAPSFATLWVSCTCVCNMISATNIVQQREKHEKVKSACVTNSTFP
jgi:hypothetical protein